MDIFPQRNKIINPESKNGDIPMLKEYAWDFEKDEILLNEGNFIIVSGIEALKVRNYLSLKTYKGRFFIYKNKVGTKLKDLIGKDKNYIKLNVSEMLEEALVDNIYVNSIEDINIEEDKGKMIISFTVVNIYSNYSTSISV